MNHNNEKEIEELDPSEMCILWIQDMCARIDIAVSNIMNVMTELNNAKNQYLKLLARLREESKKQTN